LCCCFIKGVIVYLNVIKNTPEKKSTMYFSFFKEKYYNIPVFLLPFGSFSPLRTIYYVNNMSIDCWKYFIIVQYFHFTYHKSVIVIKTQKICKYLIISIISIYAQCTYYLISN